MELLGSFTAAPAIVVICYVAAEGIKQIKGGKYSKMIPFCLMVAGAVLGVLCHRLWLSYIAAVNDLEAAAVGVISGLSATGANQLFQKFIGKGVEKDGAETDTAD